MMKVHLIALNIATQNMFNYENHNIYKKYIHKKPNIFNNELKKRGICLQEKPNTNLEKLVVFIVKLSLINQLTIIIILHKITGIVI